MSSINLIDAFQEFKDAENIDRPTMMKVVEDVFKTLLRKKFGSDENFDVIVSHHLKEKFISCPACGIACTGFFFAKNGIFNFKLI